MSSTPSISSSTRPTPTDTALATPADGAATPVASICTPDHAAYCFETLEAYFEDTQPGPPRFHNGKDAYALFVTWNTVKHGHKSLRGCIGNFSPMPLATGLRDYALVRFVLEDHRFSPIRAAELPTLAAAVSLLTPFQPVAHPLDWEVGTHGIHITFHDPSRPGKTYNATYLPEVAPEQGWTKEEAVVSLIHKAGYRGKVKPGDAVWQTIKTKVYESAKAGIDYAGYIKWKGQVA